MAPFTVQIIIDSLAPGFEMSSLDFVVYTDIIDDCNSSDYYLTEFLAVFDRFYCNHDTTVAKSYSFQIESFT